MSARLEVEGLTLAFGETEVLRGLTFDLAAGEVVGFVGPSGSGKSQALRALIGLSPPGAVIGGRATLDGQALIGAPETELDRLRGRRIGLVFQEPATALDPVMPIAAQVAEGLRGRADGGAGRGRTWARAEAAAWLARVGLDPGVIGGDRRPHALSGGQRQRVAIAAALAPGPAILMADEPTTALDPVTQAQVLGLLARLAREAGLGLLLVSHDLALVAALADRLVRIEDGRGVASGPTRAVLAGLEHPRLARRPADRAAVVGQAPILSARGISRLYPARRREAEPAGLHPSDLDLHAGETLAVVGASGAGKSTLLRLVLGLERPDTGEVRLAGERFSPLSQSRQRPLRRAIQPVFQNPAGSFDPRWSLERIVAEPLSLLDPPPDGARAARRVREVLDEVGLAAVEPSRPARALSGGQRQRLALARALAIDPAVLVLDEATSGLDPATLGQVLALLRARQARDGLAVLIVTHDVAVVRAAADRVAVLDAGRIVEHGPVETVFAAPDHPATRALLDASPSLDDALARRPSDD